MSVRMIVDIQLKPESRDELLSAYAALRAGVEGQPGLISHQLCESVDDPERWLVISEWEDLERSTAWDRSEEHARLLAPLRACFAGATRTAARVQDGVGH